MTDVNFPQDFYLDDVGVWRLKKEKLAELEKPKPMTNEEWLRSATFEEMAGAIYEWSSAGYTKGRLGLGLNPITEIVEWLKEKHE